MPATSSATPLRGIQAMYARMRAEASAKPASVTALNVPCPRCGAGETRPCPNAAREIESCDARLALRGTVRANLRALQLQTPTYRLPADGYVFQAPIYGRNFRSIPSEEWDTEIPTPEARANATFIGTRTIDGSACAVFSTGCAVFLACTLVAAQVAP